MGMGLIQVHSRASTHLRALSDRLVIEVQEARSRCFSFGQNLLRLLQVLQGKSTQRNWITS